MKRMKVMAASLSVVAMVAGCAEAPLGPTVQVMPGSNKPFEAFQQDQAACKQYASSQVSGQADNANAKAVGTTLLGAALGAGLGAAVSGGRGAGVGAAGGGVVGTAIGANNSQRAQGGIQQQYDNAYSQCMYAKGNQVIQPAPVQPVVVYPAPPPAVYYAPPPAVYYAPPPPAGYAPPPPAGYPPPPGATAAPPGSPPPSKAPPAPPGSPPPPDSQ